jgi:methionyl-tRNA formyltransferase
MARSPLRVAFAGTPDFAVPPLEALHAAGHSLVGVFTQPDRPKGRGQRLAASPVKQAALRHGLSVLQPQTLKDEAALAALTALRADVLVVVAYGLILPQALLDVPRLGCLNIHASLLPRWRGAAPIQRAILAGDEETGVSIMQMNAGLDTGPVFLQKRIPIAATDTGGTLHDKLATLGASALLETLDGMSSAALRAIEQPADGVIYAEKLQKSEAPLDWSRDSREIERQVRAFNPWPVAETRLDGEQLRVLAARAESGSIAERSTPGTVVGVQNDAIVVACGRGTLHITELQRAGKRPVSARDFANSCAIAGQRLG